MHPNGRVLIVQPVRHLAQGLHQMRGRLVDLVLMEQRHAEIVVGRGLCGSSARVLSRWAMPSCGLSLTL